MLIHTLEFLTKSVSQCSADDNNANANHDDKDNNNGNDENLKSNVNFIIVTLS